MPVKLNGATSGYVQLSAPAVAGTTSLELPTDSIKPGLVLITEQAFSAASAVNINNCFTSLYENYDIVLSATASAGGNLTLRMRGAGSDNTSAQYDWQGGSWQAATFTAYRGAGDTSARLGPTATSLQGMSVRIFSPAIAVQTVYTTKAMSAIATTPETYDFIGRCSAATSYDGFSLIPSTGTITGSLRVYGYRNSL